MRNVADIEFKKKSELTKKNRRGGALDGGVEASHCQGSISSAQHAKRMISKIVYNSVICIC